VNNFEVYIRIGEKKILQKELSTLFQDLSSLNPEEKEDFLNYLASPFFVGKDKAAKRLFTVGKSIFEKLHQLQREEVYQRSFSGSKLLTSHDANLAISKQETILRRAVKDIKYHLGKRHYIAQAYLRDTPEAATELLIRANNDRRIGNSRNAYEKWLSDLQLLPLSVNRVIRELNALHQSYFMDPQQKGPNGTIKLDRLEVKLEQCYQMLDLLIKVERINRKRNTQDADNTYGVPKLGQEYSIWEEIFSELYRLFSKPDIFDDNLFSSLKERIQQNLHLFEKNDQLSLVSLIHNYLSVASKKEKKALKKKYTNGLFFE